MVRSLRFPLLVACATGCCAAAGTEQVYGLSPAQRSFALGLFPTTHRLAEVHQGAAHHDCRRENKMCGGSGTAHPRGATASHLKPTQPCRLGPTSRTQVAARCACCGWGFIWCLGLCLVSPAAAALLRVMPQRVHARYPQPRPQHPVLMPACSHLLTAHGVAQAGAVSNGIHLGAAEGCALLQGGVSIARRVHVGGGLHLAAHCARKGWGGQGV